jgi:hypothetical protein
LPAVSSKPAHAKRFSGRPFPAAPAHPVAGFVTSWAEYDNGNPPPRHYDGPRRCPALAGFAAAARAACLIHRLIGTSPMSYNAPVKDMLFVLKELAGIDTVAQLPGFEEPATTPRRPCSTSPRSSAARCWRR